MKSAPTTADVWPDPLEKSDADQVAQELSAFWTTLAGLPELVRHDECLLAAELVQSLRGIVIDLMLALNGIRRPTDTRRLNGYLSPSQRTALERTLTAPAAQMDAWIGQAVALTVIYGWYAPQLTARFDLTYPQALEEEVWQTLSNGISAWASITSDS
jgi:hypothetical protein